MLPVKPLSAISKPSLGVDGHRFGILKPIRLKVLQILAGNSERAIDKAAYSNVRRTYAFTTRVVVEACDQQGIVRLNTDMRSQ